MLVATWAGSLAGAPLGTAFTYQGSLTFGGQPADGLYDFQFSLWDGPTRGNNVAGPFSTNGVQVTAGLFTVPVDFGAAVLDGQALWLEVAVRTNGAAEFGPLSPLQPLTGAPFALYAVNAGLSGTVIATNPANVFLGSFTGNGSGLTNLVVGPGQLTSQSVSGTNLTLSLAQSIACSAIDTYGVDRFGWTRTLSRLATNGPLCVAVVGNGWAVDSEFGGFVTNLLASKPLAGYASDVLFTLPSLILYTASSGNDTALYEEGDDTNWHGSYFVLTNTGNITAPAQTVLSDVCGTSYLANPGGGSFVLEVRTNGANPYFFTDLDNTWTTVASANAASPAWQGRTVWWTNSSPVQTQIRARATSTGWTPIVSHAQWNSTVTNGVLLCQYAHQSSGNWFTYTDTNRVFPIWNAWQAGLVFNTRGFQDSLSNLLVAELNMVRAGFPAADVVDVITHLVAPAPFPYDFERQFCLANGLPCFDGQAASLAAWGSYNNALALGLYGSPPHLSAIGYASFGQLLWSWMALTSDSAAARLPQAANGVTTNISLSSGATLHITNGQIRQITVP